MSIKAERVSMKSGAGSRNSDGRRSSRLLSLSPEAEAPAVKRSITVRKIAPRKTQALCDSNKENVSGSSAVVKSSPAAASVLSPVPPPPSPSVSALHREPEQDPVWPLRVRRSYSRQSLGDRSFGSPNARPAPPSSHNTPDTLFGFERLQTPEVMRTAAVGSFHLSAADDSVSQPPEIDPNIPGVCLGKKTARRKRVQQMKMSELDLLAAEMNAEFEEAESFELFVE